MTIGFYSGTVPTGNTRSLLYSNAAQSFRTTPGTFFSYDMPANTLETDGDSITITWWFTVTGSPSSVSNRVTIGGSGLGGSVLTGDGDGGRLRYRLVRTGTNTGMMSLELQQNLAIASTNTQSNETSGSIGATWSGVVTILAEASVLTSGRLTSNNYNITLYTA